MENSNKGIKRNNTNNKFMVKVAMRTFFMLDHIDVYGNEQAERR